MRLVLVIGVALALGQQAHACNSELLTVTDWTAEETGSARLPVKLSAEVKYQGERPFRMVHAGVMFDDVLGRSIGQVNLAPDQEAAPGDTITVDRFAYAEERLLTIDRDDVVTHACVWSIVYDDGAVEKFE